MNNNIINLLDSSIEKIKSMVDVNIVMGKLTTYNNVSVIPISKVKCGFVSGGVDQKEKERTSNIPFGGASGGSMTLTPIAFLVITENDAKILHMVRVVSSQHRCCGSTTSAPTRNIRGCTCRRDGINHAL